MRFVALIFKNLTRRKLRSALTGLAVALAVAAVIVLVGFSSGLESSTTEMYRGRSIDLVVVRTGVTQHLTSSLDESLGARLQAIAGVKAVNPSQTDIVSFGEGSLVGIPVHGWPTDGLAAKSLVITRGRALAADDRFGVLLGESLASVLGKDVGGEAEIELEKFRVVGIFAGMNVYENMTAVVRLGDLQELMDRRGQVTEFQLVLNPDVARDPVKIDAVRQKIEALADDQGHNYGLAAQNVREFVDSSTEMGLAHAMSWGTSTIAILIGSLGMWNTMMMSVLERTQEIGVLRAIGWRGGRIVRMIMLEALLLSLAGAALGAAAGLLINRALAASTWLAGLLQPTISPRVLLLGISLAIFMGVVGGLIPAVRASHLSPVEALRYE